MKKIVLTGLLLGACLLNAGDIITLRQNFFKKIQKQPDSARNHLADKDPEIRRYALYTLIKKNPLKALDAIDRALQDPDVSIRLTAVSVLPSIADKDPRIKKMLKRVASSDKSREVRQIAVRATWPFNREIKLLKNDPTWDYEVKTVKSIPLTGVPWRFTADPLQNGHLKGFFKPDHNISKWKKIRMGIWENQGLPDYDGVVWYQIRFRMPEKMDCNSVEIAFDGVDESAWVWLNGIYLGCHDIGPEGWKEPFAVDCRREIRWGKENILTIRVFDAAHAGGIYKPVRVDILK